MDTAGRPPGPAALPSVGTVHAGASFTSHSALATNLLIRVAPDVNAEMKKLEQALTSNRLCDENDPSPHRTVTRMQKVVRRDELQFERPERISASVADLTLTPRSFASRVTMRVSRLRCDYTVIALKKTDSPSPAYRQVELRADETDKQTNAKFFAPSGHGYRSCTHMTNCRSLAA
jgi:hypothetical protein